MAGGPARHACRRGSGSTRVFWFCGGALLPFVLRVVAGACVGRWTGQATAAAGGAAARGVRGIGGRIRCAGRGLERSFGAVTPLERRDPALRRGRRGLMRFWFFGGRHCAIIIPVKHTSLAPRLPFAAALPLALRWALGVFHDKVGAFLAAHAARLTPFPALAPVAALHDIPNLAVGA